MTTSPVPALSLLQETRVPKLTKAGVEHYGNMGGSELTGSNRIPIWMPGAVNEKKIASYASDTDNVKFNPITKELDGLSAWDKAMYPGLSGAVWSARRTQALEANKANAPQITVRDRTGDLYELGDEFGVKNAGNLSPAAYEQAVKRSILGKEADGRGIDRINPNTGELKTTGELTAELSKTDRFDEQKLVTEINKMNPEHVAKLKQYSDASALAGANIKSINAGITNNEALLNLKIDGLKQEAIQAAELRNQQITLSQLQNDANYRVAALQNAENARQHDAEMAWHEDQEANDTWNNIIEMITLGAMSMA